MTPDSIIEKLSALTAAIADLRQTVEIKARDHEELSEKVSRILEVVDGTGHRVALDMRLDRLERARLSERIEEVELFVLELKGVKWGLVKFLAVAMWAISLALPIILKRFF